MRVRSVLFVVLLLTAACGGSDANQLAATESALVPPPLPPPSAGAVSTTTPPAAAVGPLPPLATQTPPPAAVSLVAYLDGLDGLNDGLWEQATTAFTRAIQAAPDDPAFVLARGVAQTLDEHFEGALADLQQSRRTGSRGREAELWTYAAEAMSGLVSGEHLIGAGPRTPPGQITRGGVVSIPGNLVQGGDDYTTAYGTVIAYELGNAQQELRQAGGFSNATPVLREKSEAVRQAKKKAGQWFAARAMRRADLAPSHFARAKRLYDAREYDQALRALDYARAAYPDNPDLLYLSANCWLALGRPATARREYTLSLTSRSDFAGGYLGRAIAAARMGDRDRVERDLAMAAALDNRSTSSMKTGIDAELARYRVDDTVEQLLGQLETAATTNVSSEQLMATAIRVHRAAASHRLRYDERYQDTIREHEVAIRANPRDVSRLVALARYLVTEADNRGEAVEPRRERVDYRVQISRTNELERAVRLAELALVADPRHAGAMLQKALALTALKRYDEAERVADQALAVAGNNAEALQLYALFRSNRANQFSNEASSLRAERCTGSTREEDRGTYIERITTTTCFPPSSADLTRASQLESAAADLRRRARSAMERAVQVSKGTVDGLAIEADLRMWDGDAAAARRLLEEAVKLAPRSLEAQDRLVQFYARTGQANLSEEQQAVARQLVHTTAAPLLRLAWQQASTRAWQPAAAYLTRARQLDPIDARVPAYRGVVAEGQGRIEDAGAGYRTALALEEARVRVDEAHEPADDLLPRDPIDFALAIRMRMRLAALAERIGEPKAAIAFHRENSDLKPRFMPSLYSRQMFPAMLPDDRPEGGAAVPAPKNAATLLAESSLAAGKGLQALGMNKEAQEQFAIAASFVPVPGTMTPRIGNGRGDTNFGDRATAGSGEALFEMAKQFLAAGDVAQTQKYFQAALDAGIPDRLRPEANRMNFQIARLIEQENDKAGAAAPFRDPRSDNRNRTYEQPDRRGRDDARTTPRTARILPELVGMWELMPDNPRAPRQTLMIDADGSFAITIRDRGNVRGNATATRGQIVLRAADGSEDTLSYEFRDRYTMSIVTRDGIEYTARRR